MKLVKKVFKLVGIMAVLLTIPLAAYITTSKGVDYIHGFGKACAIIHDGWSFRGQCGVQVPPTP